MTRWAAHSPSPDLVNWTKHGRILDNTEIKWAKRAMWAPAAIEKDGKYQALSQNPVAYFMWSEGGWTGPNYSVAYAIADSPLGPFQRAGKILQQDPKVATGAGHHSVIQIPGKDEWYIVYHRRPLGEKDANHRVTCIDRMSFDEKGQILPVKITVEGVSAVPLGGGTGVSPVKD